MLNVSRSNLQSIKTKWISSMNKFKEVLESLKKLKENYKIDYKLCYRFPNSYVIITNIDFKSDEEDENELKLCSLLGIELDTLRKLSNQAMVLFECLSKEEFDNYDETERGTHWTELLIEDELGIESNPQKDEESIKVIHFFGFKGGQGRSSVLAQLAHSLINDSWKVLAIDSDLEAPSLDIIFDRKPKIENSLLGIYLNEEVEPILCQDIYGKGSLYLIGAKPDDPSWDIEYASLTLQASVNTSIVVNLANSVKKIYKEKNFDIILIDHRSGISLSPVVWQKQLNGPFVIFSKMDNQWKHSEVFLKRLIQSSRVAPYANFVSLIPYSNDPDYMNSLEVENQREAYKEILFSAVQLKYKNKDEIESISEGDMSQEIHNWHYHTHYSKNLLPALVTLGNENEESIRNLRKSLNIGEKRGKDEKSDSGIRDTRVFIVTKELANIINPDSPITYIFGRKGTGKTRIFRELINKNVKVKPLLAQDDYFEEEKNKPDYIFEGVNANQIKKVIDSINQDKKIFPEAEGKEPNKTLLKRFWWCILYYALLTLKENEGILSSEKIVKLLKENLNPQNLKRIDYEEEVSLFLETKKDKDKIIFAIDGLETTFHSKYIRGYVDALQEVIEEISGIPSLYKFIGIKLFIRTDLKNPSGQNYNQKDHRRAELKWTKESIFNFLVSSILFRAFDQKDEEKYEKFNEFLKKNLLECYSEETIKEYKKRIQRAELSVKDCTELLKTIFDEKLGAGNAYLETFFTQFFTDTEKSDAQYYPRVYDLFLDSLGETYPGIDSFKDIKFNKKKIKVIKNAPVIKAYEFAAAGDEDKKKGKGYIRSLSEELEFLLDFTDKEIETFIKSFEGMKTPFDKKEMVQHITNEMVVNHPNLKMEGRIGVRKKVEKALESLVSIGILEYQPDLRLRAGRLIKAAFKMTYGQ